ncbi:4-alpha-glucanotransferase [Robbsia sp. Bb-Pol-6]|uniref:4-alpha-glucanotransferase n=1 Tax=Robbsia betulipollinis TaxID=2981849 RepID=A0ABT3ZKF4_9BURK|nr:4-alpha-glucanotransferase [Robbsia betulipollinis]MCY0386435.1 4-alpha-glucanotransferase [Robbsia betulipollinis]
MNDRTPDHEPDHAPALPPGIATLAERAGFQIDWEDAHGAAQRVPDAMLATLLERLGLPCRSEATLRESLATLDAESPARRLPPLLTAVVGEDIVLPAGLVPAHAPYSVELENGERIEGTVAALPGTAAASSADAATAATAATVRIAPIDRAGYHTLKLADREVRLAVAPPRCFSVADALAHAPAASGADATEAAGAVGALPAHTPHVQFTPRVWGISAQVYGLRREGDAGVGDFTALQMLARQGAQAGAGAVAISPMHAMFSADPGKFSPYSPSSRLFVNVLHIDPAARFGQEAARAAIASLDLSPTLSELENAPLIDWPGVARARLAILRVLFDQARAGKDAMLDDFKRFCEAGGDALENHARFEALHAHLIAQAAEAKEPNGTGAESPSEDAPNPRDWRRWPATLRDVGSPDVSAFATAHRDEIDFHLFLQWLADAGLADAQRAAREAGMPIGLIADLAVGCDASGSQTWSDPASMLQGLSVGAPPDLFNQAGQAWGLTTFSPRALVNGGFAAFIDMVRHAFAHAGGIRVDHILGLRRLWLVPEGESARNGAYLLYPIEDLLRLLALESWRYHAVVIGEDLGTVPDGLREQLAGAGLLGMRVLWFERTSPEVPGTDDAVLGARIGGPSDIADITDLSDLAGLGAVTDIAGIVSLSDENDENDENDEAGEADAHEPEAPEADAPQAEADEPEAELESLDADTPDAPDAGDDASLANRVSEVRDPFVAPDSWSTDAIAMTTTHDLPTIAGWWAGHDIVWRERIGQSSGGQEGVQREQTERLSDRALLWRALRDAGIVPAGTPEPEHPPVDAILRFVAATAAPLALFPLEDLLGLADQPNLPGSTDEHPNWRRRLPFSLNRLLGADPHADPVHGRLRLIDSTRHSHRS